ncbi:hypothetical protein CGLO_02369 [Colletotrichum gloeosporioides Cg-14]|uniref:Uncharacterized protein n=1 Tax=Colletotrichum gloeosporioides (strain Cg-14) TaxID=1237896 RepID=T0M165_COLGC|nr:hypothetical protein CGLO_02369 [Colletotrichum gloeosporioides Cg-14]
MHLWHSTTLQKVWNYNATLACEYWTISACPCPQIA